MSDRKYAPHGRHARQKHQTLFRSSSRLDGRLSGAHVLVQHVLSGEARGAVDHVTVRARRQSRQLLRAGLGGQVSVLEAEGKRSADLGELGAEPVAPEQLFSRYCKWWRRLLPSMPPAPVTTALKPCAPQRLRLKRAAASALARIFCPLLAFPAKTDEAFERSGTAERPRRLSAHHAPPCGLTYRHHRRSCRVLQAPNLGESAAGSRGILCGPDRTGS
eukprot:scaffold453_cov243-Pinguiococcus_pyrenoidosus.AAC.6